MAMSSSSSMSSRISSATSPSRIARSGVSPATPLARLANLSSAAFAASCASAFMMSATPSHCWLRSWVSITRSMTRLELVRAARWLAQYTARSHSGVSSMTTRYFRLCPASWLRRLRLIGPPRASARPMRYVARAGMLPRAAGRRQGMRLASAGGSDSLAHEPDDVLDGAHGLGSDLLRAPRAVSEHRVDIGRVLQQPPELAADRAELGGGELDQLGLEGGELRAAELAQHVGRRGVGERRVDADQVGGLGARGKPGFLMRQRIRIGL